MNELITGALFKRMVLHGAAAITAQKQAINDLNVFPVPDGDTGTNMSMTIGTAVTELRKSEPATVDKAASVTASALLRGARGNSGVILSLLFRGLSKGLKGMETAGAAAFAAAMQEGGVGRSGPDHRYEPRTEKGGRCGRRRQGLPPDSGGYAGRAAGRAHA